MKTTRLLIIGSLLFSFLTFNVFAQDCSTTWLYTTPTNEVLGTPICFATNQYAYALSGNLEYQPEYEYAPINTDGSLGQWTTINTNNVALDWYEESGILVGNNVYVAGGYISGETYSSNCYLAQIGSNGQLSTFMQQPSMNQTGAAFAMAYSNGYLYRIGYGEDVEYSKVSTNGNLEGWNYTSSLTTGFGASPSAFVSNGYIYTISFMYGFGGGNSIYFVRAQQNANGTLNPWEIASGQLPLDGPIPFILSADNQIYLIGNGNSIYKASFDPLSGTIGSFTTDSRQPFNIGTAEGTFATWPYLYIIGYSGSTMVTEYTCDTMTQKDFEFASSADTGEWVYESVSGTSTEPTVSWVSSYNGSTTGALMIQFTQANQGVKMTLFKAGWFGSISTNWYEMKAQVGSDDTVYPNDLYAVGILYNGAYTPPIDIVGHGLYSLASGWNYLYDFQQSYGGVSMYPQLTFKNNDVYPATMYLESVEVKPISSPGN